MKLYTKKSLGRCFLFDYVNHIQLLFVFLEVYARIY